MMNGQNPIYVISFTSRPAKNEADPENEDDFVLEEINLDEVEPEDMTRRYCGGYYESDLCRGSDTGENPGRNGGI